MDTTRIKRFATEARDILKAGIAAKIISLGFDKQGNVPEAHRPQLMQGGSLWNGQLRTESFYHLWTSLYRRIQRKGINEVSEEAAYTWFNRLCAIRILQKNGLCEAVLDYADAARTPRIVDEARQGHLPPMTDEIRRRVEELLDDDRKVPEQFAALITAFCHATPILHRCFGHIADYTELLLPANILAEGGFVDMLNHTEFLTDEDYRSSELIGWLYQFYIAEKKDEVFAGKGKFTASEIPAATQIFTPNWIVKYMVQNTVGRIYLDNNPYETEVAQDWKYLVNPSVPTPDDRILRYDDLTDLRLADLACGSGHILGEMFDILYTLYINEGYSRREAIEHIFRRNLTGIDIDTRAKQLAQFALLLKACQRDAAFADCRCMPRVLDMPKAGLPLPADTQLAAEIDAANQLLADADTLGSIMKFRLSPAAREWVASLAEENEAAQLVLALTEQYHALVMNPPYMGGGNMNTMLSNYVKKNYEAGKADLFSVFMQVCDEHLTENGKYGMINLPSWLFLSTFEKLRTKLLENYHIDSLLHMGRGIFGIDWGSVAFVATKAQETSNGVYFRLHKRNFQHIYYYHIEQLFLKALEDHSFKYNFDSYRDEEGRVSTFTLLHDENGLQLYYVANQQNFKKIPGCPIGYWVSPKIQEVFTSNLALSAVCSPTQGLATADNARFLRLWFEVSQSRIGFGCENAASAARSQKKWFPYNKGGSARKWYGNQEFIVNWENDGYEIKHIVDEKGKLRSRPQNVDYYFKPSISWSKISSGIIAFRAFPQGFIFDVAGTSLFPNIEYSFNYLIGLVNSIVIRHILSVMSPTLNYEVGQIANLPIIYSNSNQIEDITGQNISISKSDWDAHETSWDFEENELVRLGKEQGEGPHRLADLLEAYKEHWTEQFLRLHANEEELNRQFIGIYGLEDELTPDVPPEEITILQQGELTFE